MRTFTSSFINESYEDHGYTDIYYEFEVTYSNGKREFTQYTYSVPVEKVIDRLVEEPYLIRHYIDRYDENSQLDINDLSSLRKYIRDNYDAILSREFDRISDLFEEEASEECREYFE